MEGSFLPGELLLAGVGRVLPGVENVFENSLIAPLFWRFHLLKSRALRYCKSRVSKS